MAAWQRLPLSTTRHGSTAKTSLATTSTSAVLLRSYAGVCYVANMMPRHPIAASSGRTATRVKSGRAGEHLDADEGELLLPHACADVALGLADPERPHERKLDAGAGLLHRQARGT